MEVSTRETGPPAERDTLAAPVRPPPRAGDDAFAESFEGQRIHRFHVLGRIGAGGMGTVYLAHDPMLGRDVAIKLARMDRTRPSMIDESRIHREAKLLAQVRHPNVVEVYEVGVIHGHVYIVMALIRGRTLRMWQREQPRSWRATIEKYVAAARGLQAAHAVGLVHRDFKADNVLVGDDDRVHVVDFGLARPAGAATDSSTTNASSSALSSDSPLTQTGAVVGTPGYMAPEQRAGRPPDLRSDIYSFCVSLFEALHGHRPEFNLDPKATRGHRRKIPRWIDRALAQGLAPDPAKRYASFEPLLAALGRDPARWWRRAGLAVGLVAAGGAAGLAAPGVSEETGDKCAGALARIDDVWGPAQRERLAALFRGATDNYRQTIGRRVEAALEAYADSWKQARRRNCEAAGALAVGAAPQLLREVACLERAVERVGAAVDLLEFAGPGDVEQAMALVEALPRIADCRDAPARDEHEMSVRTGLIDELRRALITARARGATGAYREATRLAEQVRARAQKVGDPSIEADALLTVGQLRADDGDMTGAETSLLAAIDVAEANRLDDITASGWVSLTTVTARLHANPERMRERARRAQALLDRLDDTGPRRAILLNALGFALRDEGDYAEAVRLHREALERLEFASGPQLEIIRSLQQLGSALEGVGRLEAARQSFLEALNLCTIHLAPRHPELARVSHNFGVLLVSTGETTQARSLIETALSILTERFGPVCVECGRVNASLAHEASVSGEFGRAEHHARRALAINRQVLPEQHPDLATALGNLGAILHWRGDYAGAVAAYQEAIRRQDRILPEGHMHRAITESNLGESLVALQRHDEALSRFAAAEPVFRAAGAAGEDSLILLLRAKGQALAGTGDVRAARVALEQARALLKRAERLEDAAEVERELAALARTG